MSFQQGKIKDFKTSFMLNMNGLFEMSIFNFGNKCYFFLFLRSVLGY